MSFQNRESPRRIILLAALIAATITIPLFNNLNSIALIFFVFACLIQRPMEESAKKLSASRMWIFPLLYFLWLACSYFWDVTGGFAVRDIERYAAFFFIPPAMVIMPRISSKQLRIVCLSFVAVTTALAVICLVKSYIEYQHTHDYRVFYYHYLAQQVDLNAIFLSNYCLASIAWMLYYGFISERKRSRLTYPVVANSVFLFVMIFLLSSKLVIILMLLTLLIFVLYIGYLRGYFLRSMGVVILVMVMALIAVNNLPYLKWRIDVTQFREYRGEQDNQNGLSIRLLMWRNAIDLISQRPLLGYGVRGARQRTVEKFRKENFMLGYKEGYHSHNQYLESLLMGGVPALVLLVATIISIGRRAWKTRNFLLMTGLLHFLIQSMIESTFEVQQELIFFMFFLFLFYYHPPLPED